MKGFAIRFSLAANGNETNEKNNEPNQKSGFAIYFSVPLKNWWDLWVEYACGFDKKP